MNFKTENRDGVSIDISGTHLVGYLGQPYETITKLFGEPSGGDEHKTDAEWVIEFEDGTIATIYNWKNGKNYLGNNGTPVEEMDSWNVGGNSKIAYFRIMGVINQNL